MSTARPTHINHSPLIVAAIAVAAGLLVAIDTRLLLIPGGLLLSVLLATRAEARLMVLVFGGLVTLQSSGELDAVKIAYLAAAAATVILSAISLRAEVLERDVWLPLGFISASFVFMVIVSLPVAMSFATPIDFWLRDIASYVLVAAAPIVALDAARHITASRFRAMFVVLGLFATAAFTIEWLGRRQFADIALGHLALPTFLLPAALFGASLAFSFGGPRRAHWSAVAIIVIAGLVLTGTRSTIVLASALPAAVLFSAGRPLQRGAQLLLYLTIAVVCTFAVVQAMVTFLGIDGSLLSDRFGSIANVVQGLQPDQSTDERGLQGAAALAEFARSPVFGSGPGRIIPWINAFGLAVFAFTLDTPFAYLAKFGLGGVLVLLIVAGSWVSVLRPRVEIDGEDRVAAICFSVVLLSYAVLASPFDDKGLGFAAVFILAPLLRRRPLPLT
jgi:hypothetical protein